MSNNQDEPIYQLTELVRFHRYHSGLEDLTDDFGNVLAKKKAESEIDKEYLLDLNGFINNQINLFLENHSSNKLHFFSLKEFISYFFTNSIENQEINKLRNSYLQKELKNKLIKIENEDKIYIKDIEINFSEYFKKNKKYLSIKDKKIKYIKDLKTRLSKDTSLNFIDKEGNPHSYNYSEKLMCFIYSKIEVYNRLTNKNKQPFKKEEDSLSKSIVDLFVKLQHTSINENYFFDGCPFQVYKEFFDKRLDDFKKNNIDVSIVDFLKEECKFFSEKNELSFNNEAISLPDINELTNKISYSNSSKLMFIEEKLLQNGYEVIKANNDKNTLEDTFRFNNVTKTGNTKTTANSQEPANQKEHHGKVKDKDDNDYPKHIFRPGNSYNYFKWCLEHLGFYKKKGSPKRGFMAYANAIFQNETFREKHFIPSLNTNDYIQFLIKYYKIKETTKKLSKIGVKHEDSVKEFLSAFPFEKYYE